MPSEPAYRVPDEREREAVARLMRMFGEFTTWRNNFAGQWEESCELIWPEARNTFYYGSFNFPGDKKTDRQIDSSGALALHQFTAIADSLVTPSSMKWHGLEANNEYVMKDRATRLWFENTTRTLFKYRYAAQANFRAQNVSNWKSVGALGNASMYIDKLDHHGAKGLRYKSVPLGESFFGENHQGIVDRHVRWFRRTAYQAAQQFGREGLPEQIHAALERDSLWPFNFLHFVMPREDYDPDRLDARGLPFSSHYVSVEGQCLMQPEKGFRVFPYAVSRYEQAPGEVYGRGPAQIVLPALKTLNAQKRVYLKQGHRAGDPVLLMADEGIMNFSLRPGAMNPGGVNPDGKPLVHVLPAGDIQLTHEMMLEERGLIQDVFLVSLFKALHDHPNMTATQVIELVNEKGMLTAPTLGRQSEYIGGMVGRELDLLSQQGLLEPMPPRLKEAGGEYEVVDTSPLALARRAGEAAGFMRTIESVKELVNITQDVSLLDPFDFDTAVPEIASIQAVPERWMSDAKKVAGKRQVRAKAQQVQQQIQAMPAQAAMLKAQATVVEKAPPGAMQ